MDNHVVIMAGGIGSRFWPMSTPGLKTTRTSGFFSCRRLYSHRELSTHSRNSFLQEVVGFFTVGSKFVCKTQ